MKHYSTKRCYFFSVSKKMILCLLGILFFTGCTSKEQPSVSVYYTPESGEYVHNVYGLGTTHGNELSYETLEEAEKKGKSVLTLFATKTAGFVRDMANAFNCENEKYHIEVEVFEQKEVRERQNNLKIEIVAGNGPDLMTYGAMPYASEIMDKGCFVDLVPLMKLAGITDEFYFPGYKSLIYEDHVYGLSPYCSVVGMAVKEEVIGGKELPSFEEFVEDVLNYSKDAVLLNDTQNPDKILEYFLESSESLWGMINWKEKTCDFDCDLFYNILDVVKRYSEARNKGFEPIMQTVTLTPGTAPGKEYYEDEKFVIIDSWFDDGNYPKNNVSFSTLMINSKTENLEGAWAFVSYCLSLEGQSYEYGSPVNKEAFDMMYEDIRSLFKSEEEAEKNYPRSQIADYKALNEQGKSIPYMVEPILNIIEEEAGAYWSGSKSEEEVVNIIQNRVSVFLKE